MDKIYIVIDEFGPEAFRNQKDAIKYFKERMKYYKSHKPDENDMRKYTLRNYYEDDNPFLYRKVEVYYKYAWFADAHFQLSCIEKTIR